MFRQRSAHSITPVAVWAAAGEHPTSAGEWSLDDDQLVETIVRTRQPARQDDWRTAQGPIAAAIRDVLGVRSTVGCPVVVEGGVWGELSSIHGRQRAAQRRRGASEQLHGAGGHGDRERVRARRAARAGGQAGGVRRVATLVRDRAPPDEVFAAVAGEPGGAVAVHGADRPLRATTTRSSSAARRRAAVRVDIRIGPRGA